MDDGSCGPFRACGASEISLKFHTYALTEKFIYYSSMHSPTNTATLPANQKRILVDGKEFLVRDNLCTFFHQQTYVGRTQLI